MVTGTGSINGWKTRSAPQGRRDRPVPLPWVQDQPARYREFGTAGSASGPGKRAGGNTGTAPWADSTTVSAAGRTPWSTGGTRGSGVLAGSAVRPG